jgi:hypothetical protein
MVPLKAAYMVPLKAAYMVPLKAAYMVPLKAAYMVPYPESSLWARRDLIHGSDFFEQPLITSDNFS